MSQSVPRTLYAENPLWPEKIEMFLKLRIVERDRYKATRPYNGLEVEMFPDLCQNPILFCGIQAAPCYIHHAYEHLCIDLCECLIQQSGLLRKKLFLCQKAFVTQISESLNCIRDEQLAISCQFNCFLSNAES